MWDKKGVNMRIASLLIAVLVLVGLAGCAYDHTKNDFVVGKSTRAEVEAKAGAPVLSYPFMGDGKPGSHIVYSAPSVKDGIHYRTEDYQFDKDNILVDKSPY